MQNINNIKSIHTEYIPYMSDNNTNTHVYVVINKLDPLTDISVFDENSETALMFIDESKYKIIKLPVITGNK